MTVYQSIGVTCCRAGGMLDECLCTSISCILHLLEYAKILLPCCFMWNMGWPYNRAKK
jgi:hypothetical protein